MIVVYSAMRVVERGVLVAGLGFAGVDGRGFCGLGWVGAGVVLLGCCAAMLGGVIVLERI